MIEAIARLRRLFLGPFALAMLALRAGAMILWLAYLYPISTDLSFPEGSLTATAWNVAHGEAAYTDWREWPHRFAPYGPLTYYPVGFIARLVPGGVDARTVCLLGRGQSALALVAICVFACLIAGRITGSWRWGLLALPLVLSWDPVLTFVLSYRPDAPQTAFGLLALILAMGGPARGRRLVGVLVALSISMWFKPATFGCILAIAFWVYESRGPRTTAIAFAAFGLINLALASALNFATGGNLFLNMIHSMNNGLAPNNLGRFFSYVALVPGLLYITGISHSLWRFTGKRSEGTERLFHFAVCIEVLTCSLQLMKVGADLNYLIMSYMLAIVSTLLLVRSIWLSASRPAVREALCWLVLVPMILHEAWYAVDGLGRDMKSVRAAWAPTPMARAAARYTGPIVTLNPFVAVVNPGTPTVLDYVQYTILRERGLLSDEALISRVEQRKFAAMILPERKPGEATVWFSPRFLPAMRANYVPSSHFGNLYVFVPRTDTPPKP